MAGNKILFSAKCLNIMFAGNNREGNSCGVYMTDIVVEGTGTPAKDGKRIHERDQCCAGSIFTSAEYKVINNKMVLVKKRCFKWEDKKQELVERKIEDCQ